MTTLCFSRLTFEAFSYSISFPMCFGGCVVCATNATGSTVQARSLFEVKIILACDRALLHVWQQVASCGAYDVDSWTLELCIHVRTTHNNYCACTNYGQECPRACVHSVITLSAHSKFAL